MNPNLTVTFGEGTDEDTMHLLLEGVAATFTDGIESIQGIWVGTIEDFAVLHKYDPSISDFAYSNTVRIPIDCITGIVVA